MKIFLNFPKKQDIFLNQKDNFMFRIDDFKKKKKQGQKITMVTCYDNWTARILGKTGVDSLLVGDSVAMVVHGFDSTIHAHVEMMATHTAAVVRAQVKQFIMTDLPFLAHRKGTQFLMEAVEKLMKSGAHALKIEAAWGQEDVVRYISDSGVPVIGHLGLTPQYIYQLGGYKVQGKDSGTSQRIFQQALELEQSGCYALVLECVPRQLAQKITQKLSIPTIGIGAGDFVDGQVLVLQDLLGFNEDFSPRFLRRFAQGEKWMQNGIKGFTDSVQDLSFPSQAESFL